MGYTNYWKPKKFDSVDRGFMADAEKIIDYAILSEGVVLTNGDEETLIGSGKEAFDNGEIIFNGYGEDAHEGFCLSFDGKWAFCKTAHKPYDQVVKAVLILAEKYGLLEGPFAFDGDRREKEYKAGKRLLENALHYQNWKTNNNQ